MSTSAPNDDQLRNTLEAIRYSAAALLRATPAQRATVADDIAEAADLVLPAAEYVGECGPPVEVEVYPKSPVSLTDRRPRVEPVPLMTFQTAA